MRTRRSGRTAAALLALAVAGTPALLADTPARAAAVFVETNPSTVAAGEEIGVRASCQENLQAATVRSDAFGTVTVRPQYGFLTATVTVPRRAAAASYRVRLTCPDGDTATNTLHVVARNRPARGPATGFGGSAGGGWGAPLIGVGLVAIVAGAVLSVRTARRRPPA